METAVIHTMSQEDETMSFHDSLLVMNSSFWLSVRASGE